MYGMTSKIKDAFSLSQHSEVQYTVLELLKMI